MGYEIHITRKTEWFDEDGPEISLEDWKAYIASDPEMRLDGYAEATMENGDVFRTEHDGIAVWTAYSGHGVDGNMAWLYPGSGGIVAKNPDREILAKMFEIAQALGARVVGDEGEEYGTGWGNGRSRRGGRRSCIARHEAGQASVVEDILMRKG